MHHRRIIAGRALSILSRNYSHAHAYIHPRILSLAHQARPPSTRKFHTTGRLLEENHYNILESSPNASPAHLKKQFYALSKKHHPDLHPEDSAAAQRFVRISTAWSVLGNASKRATYDRELAARDPSVFASSRSNSAHSGAGVAPHGSHSSAQAQSWGARPASGLSRRRGAFRGPPPSFYRAGGWGNHEGKRRAAAEGAESAAFRGTQGRDAGAESAAGNGGGFAPGQGYEHADYEIPHFDRVGHFRRQEGVQESLKKRKIIWAEREALARERDDAGGGGGTWERILLVSGVLATTAVMGWIWEWRVGRKNDR